MAAERIVKERRPRAKIDVRGGEFLRYEVSFKGAKAKFDVVDEEGRLLMDETADKKDGAYVAEWPPEGGWVWDGADVHAFLGIMTRVTQYRFRCLHCSPSGSTLEIVRDVVFKKRKNTDVAPELVRVFVKQQGDGA